MPEQEVERLRRGGALVIAAELFRRTKIVGEMLQEVQETVRNEGDEGRHVVEAILSRILDALEGVPFPYGAVALLSAFSMVLGGALVEALDEEADPLLAAARLSDMDPLDWVELQRVLTTEEA